LKRQMLKHDFNRKRKIKLSEQTNIKTNNIRYQRTSEGSISKKVLHKISPEPGVSKRVIKGKMATGRSLSKAETSGVDSFVPKANNELELSILLIGATGAIGIECLRRLSRHEKKPEIKAFCHNLSNLSDVEKSKCKMVVEGDAREEEDIEWALRKTKSNFVVVCIGNGNCFEKNGKGSDVRTTSAHALVNVMRRKEFKHVRAVVVSRFGVETIDSYRQNRKVLWKSIMKGNYLTRSHESKLRYILEDHAGQENVIMSTLPERITIVRPTALNENKATGTVQVFTLPNQPPTTEIPRLDLASWIAEEICCGVLIGGKVISITGSENM